MSNKRVKDAKKLLNFMLSVNVSNKQYVSKVIELYIESKIEKFKEAENLLIKLTSRGTGPKKAIEKINSYSEFKEKRIQKRKEKQKQKQEEEIKRLAKKMPTQIYHVSGTILTKTQYFWTNKKQGEKSKKYDDSYQDAMKIKATSKEAVIKYFEKVMTERYTIDRHTVDISIHFKSRKVTGFQNINCQSESNFNASSENNMLMKSAKPIKYNFFESDDQYLKDNGFCH